MSRPHVSHSPAWFYKRVIAPAWSLQRVIAPAWSLQRVIALAYCCPMRG